MTPLIHNTDQGPTPNMKCYYQQGCLRKLVNHEGKVKDFQRTCTINDAVFKVVWVWNSMKAKSVLQAGGNCGQL